MTLPPSATMACPSIIGTASRKRETASVPSAREADSSASWLGSVALASVESSDAETSRAPSTASSSSSSAGRGSNFPCEVHRGGGGLQYSA